MYHSITFEDVTNDILKNTYDDWHLVPSSRPTIVMPEQKTNYISIDGSDGQLDLSESLTGYPIYENRSDSIEFYVLNGFGDWAERYSEIANFLHGKKRRMILEDDSSYYYEGRFSMGWNSDNSDGYSRITINYDVAPYKRKIEETEIVASASQSPLIIDGYEYGPYAATAPEIYLGSGITEFTLTNQNGVSVTVPSTGITHDIYRVYPGITMYGGDSTFTFTGTGQIKIKFHKGSL